MGATLKILGDVVEILEGRVISDHLKLVQPTSFRFALGGATFSNEHCIGETLIVGGISHISWVEKGKLCNGSQSKVWSPFLMGIGREKGVLLEKVNLMSLEMLYQKLADQYPMGCALVGSFQMVKLETIYLKRAPIYHENINTHRELYWSNVESVRGAIVCLFGVVIPAAAKKEFSEEILSRAFYDNPRDIHHLSFESHTHAAFTDRLTLASEPEALLQELEHLKIKGVRHVLTSSILQEGKGVIFPLQAIETVNHGD